MPREESFPIPLRYIDVTRATSTTLDVMLERRIDDNRNIDGARDLSVSWTGSTTLLEEKPPDGFSWLEGVTKKQTTSRPDYLWIEIWKDMSEAAQRIFERERAVRRVKEGTSAVLLQSGLDEKWWADSMECYCYLRNSQDLLSDEKTPYERRFGMPFNGSVIPFGAMVECHPISAKDMSRLHQFGAKVLPGIFLSYALNEENLEGRHCGRRH